MDWKNYWIEFPKKFSETDFAQQVQYTIRGKSIGDDAIARIADGIIEDLAISRNDSVLDLCCGNGMFTVLIGAHCDDIVGVDYSGPMINIANKYNKNLNIKYVESDAVDYLYNCVQSGRKFDKIFASGAFQYFERDKGRALIKGMAQVLDRDGKILLSGVPDARRKSGLYDTPSKRLRHIWRVLTRREQIGVWWTEAALRSICQEVGLACEFKDSRGQTSKPYRFDAILSASAVGRPVR